MHWHHQSDIAQSRFQPTIHQLTTTVSFSFNINLPSSNSWTTRVHHSCPTWISLRHTTTCTHTHINIPSVFQSLLSTYSNCIHRTIATLCHESIHLCYNTIDQIDHLLSSIDSPLTCKDDADDTNCNTKQHREPQTCWKLDRIRRCMSIIIMLIYDVNSPIWAVRVVEWRRPQDQEY